MIPKLMLNIGEIIFVKTVEFAAKTIPCFQ